MLPHAAARAVIGRTAPASFRISSTALLARNYAKDARPSNSRRTPLPIQRKAQSEPTRSAGFGGPTSAGKQNVPRSSPNAAQEIDSRATAELDGSATPARNTEPGKNQTWRQGDPIEFAAATTGAQAASRTRDESVKQEAESRNTAEFDQSATPIRNTEPTSQPGPGTPQSRSRRNSKAQDEFQSPQQPAQPLPDLRQGIPSTFDAEFISKATSGREGKQDLDIAESREQEDPASAEGAGRGGDRELPKSAYESSVDRRRNNVAYYAYLIMASFGLSGAIYFGRNWANEEEERRHPDAPSGWSLSLMWKRIKARLGGQVSYYTEPAFQKLLPDMDPNMRPPMTLVLSLEDLLIHSEWTREHGWRMAKRPGLDYFLRYLSQYFELVIFTSVPSQSGIPVIQKLDPFHVVMWPLFREATRYENGQYIKVSAHAKPLLPYHLLY